MSEPLFLKKVKAALCDCFGSDQSDNINQMKAIIRGAICCLNANLFESGLGLGKFPSPSFLNSNFKIYLFLKILQKN